MTSPHPLSPGAAQALDAFQQAGSWEQRARLLMQWGEKLEPLSDSQRVEENRVHGCESQVWLVAEQVDQQWQFRAAGEARLIRGLLALLLVRVNGLDSQALAQLDLNDWFNQLGLARQLSPSRSNGLNAVLKRMRELASAA
ncbi:SufE family protein [Pseudomonas segetis]|uniref:Cysteine desulfuration protein SufE n=1 Tax=Pseudomonas segetis TaxID=298908 RepID=A0A239CBQ8_9PSED|nr:SufE family protein [Pseudomonas segetis]SNS17061.1 Cysteine desulfuration protein SufE [Pseudomonas segetis]